MNPAKGPMTSTKPVALITGASSGIGLELARLCARGGHDVILVARNAPKLEELAKYLGGMYNVRTEVIVADLEDPEAPQAILEEVERRGLGVDVLINNAGFGDWGLFGRAGLEKQLAMVQVNIVALMILTRLVLPRMVSQRKGRILNVASTAAFQPGPLMATYYASKAFVLSFSQALSNEFKGTGITVTALCPGPTSTKFFEVANLPQNIPMTGPFMMPVEPVAEAGYHGMMRGSTVVVPGFLNKLLVFSGRLVPRSIPTAIARRIQEGRGNG